MFITTNVVPSVFFGYCSVFGLYAFHYHRIAVSILFASTSPIPGTLVNWVWSSFIRSSSVLRCRKFTMFLALSPLMSSTQYARKLNAGFTDLVPNCRHNVFSSRHFSAVVFISSNVSFIVPVQFMNVRLISQIN